MSDYQELLQRFTAVLDRLAEIERQADKVQQQINELEQLPMTNATIHWRKDRHGQPEILELLHSQDSIYYLETGRRREYIGKDPARIAEAKERRKRFKRHRELRSELISLDYEARVIRSSIDSLELRTREKQAELFGKETWGQNDADQVDDISPQNELVIVSPRPNSPQEVVDYFEASPVLSYMADDLRRSFKHYGLLDVGTTK